MRRLAVAGLVLGGGCGFTPDGAPVGAPDAGPALVDADTGPDAGVLGLNASCDPLASACATGFTCRPRVGGPGLCRPVGEIPVGGRCAAAEGDDCVVGAACEDVDGAPACVAVCGAGTPTCSCTPHWTATVGYCR